MEKLNFNHLSNRLIDRETNPSTRTNRLIEAIIKENSDIISPLWVNRHAKLCYKIGLPAYDELVRKARKFGKNPERLLAHLVDKELRLLTKNEQTANIKS